MYKKIKKNIKYKIVQVASDVATKIANEKAREVASQVASDVATEVANQTALQVSNKTISNIDIKLSQATHIIFELLKQFNMLKTVSNENIWEKNRHKHLGLWIGEVNHIVDGKKPIDGFFGGGINCVLGDLSLKVVGNHDTLDDIEVLVFWGQSSHINYLPLIHLAVLKNKEILFVEDGFIYNFISHSKSLTNSYYKEWIVGMSFTIDDITAHFDGSMASRLEQMIASDYIINSLEISRSKNLIDKIVQNNITKYNYQSLEEKVFGSCKQKVLVVDQAYGDYSVYKSGATEQVFSKMLDDALNENPDTDVLVKVHPDMIANPNRAGAKNGGYFASMQLSDSRIILIKEEINPYIIINQVQKVYVCTSQLGFESLMAGKEVITYGVPFYAGWGITIDRGNPDSLKRRSLKKRTLIELFWFAYIWYSRYFNPIKKEKCEIEDVLDYIIDGREMMIEKI